MKIFKIEKNLDNKYRGCGKALIAVKNEQIQDFAYYSDFEEQVKVTMITDRRVKNKLVSNKNFRKYAKVMILNLFNSNKKKRIFDFKNKGFEVYSAMLSCGEAVVIGDFCKK